jgi:hypothetical protein
MIAQSYLKTAVLGMVTAVNIAIPQTSYGDTVVPSRSSSSWSGSGSGEIKGEVIPLFKPKNNRYELSTSSDFDVVPAEKSAVTDVEQIVARAKSRIGLTATMTAKFVGVSRPTLYNHIKGNDHEPKSMDGYVKLEDLLTQLEVAGVNDIKRGLKSVLINGSTLLARLRNHKKLDTNEFVSAAKIVSEKIASRDNSKVVPRSVQRAATQHITKMG